MTGEGTPFDDILTLMALDFAAAKARLQDMVRAEPDSFDAHFMLGFIHSRRQDYGAAATALSRAVEIRPGAQVALFNLGYCRQQLGDLAGALEYYRAALRASGGSYGDASVLAGQCYHRLGDAAVACALLETALADHPNDARLFYVLMGALRDEGRDGAADRRAARLGELVADERDEVGLAEFFNRYDHHGWARLDNKATLAGMVAGCPWQPESFAMPGGFADLETAHERHGGPWIVKPAALFGGQGITVTDDLARVPREDGWLVQRYINDPYLIDGKKFHLRLYVLVTSVAPPEAWLWHDGIVRFAAEVYRVDPEHFAREAMHVTNTVRFQDHPDLVVADDVADDGTGNVWSLDAMYRRLEDDCAE